jgi:ElaB/YqjD/DUF883 family membrane-anchored ribosome-binding protein
MENIENQTYREVIQKQASELDKIFDNAESLRDFATLEEKDSWNQLRNFTSKAMSVLHKLDNKLSQDRAMMQVNHNY